VQRAREEHGRGRRKTSVSASSSRCGKENEMDGQRGTEGHAQILPFLEPIVKLLDFPVRSDGDLDCLAAADGTVRSFLRLERVGVDGVVADVLLDRITVRRTRYEYGWERDQGTQNVSERYEGEMSMRRGGKTSGDDAKSLYEPSYSCRGRERKK
jgi:hypothetical protein